MMNIHLSHSDDEAIVDLVKDHEEHHGRTNENLKEKAWKDCLGKDSQAGVTSLNTKGVAMEN